MHSCQRLFDRQNYHKYFGLFREAGIHPSGLKFGEDLVVNMNLFPHIKRNYAIDRIVYNYYIGIPGSSDKYLDSWLENLKQLYFLKMETLKKDNYEEGLFFQKVELVNYLKSYVNGCIKFRRKNKTANVNHLKKNLYTSMCNDIKTLIDSRYKDKIAAELLSSGDALSFYEMMEQRHESLPYRQRLLDAGCRIFRWVLDRFK